MRRLVLGAVALLIAVAAQIGVAKEKPVEAQVDGSPFLVDVGVSPKTLPRTEPQEVKLGVTVELGSPQSALKELQLRLDRDIDLDGGGIPPCTGSGRAIRRDLPEIEDLCRESIVGRGDIGITITFPDQAPIAVGSEMVILGGGGREGVSTFYAVAHITVPTPTLVGFTLKARKNVRGRYGTLVRMDAPVIAGGYGVIDEFSLVFGRRAAGGAARDGVAAAACTRGRLQAEAKAMFRNGSGERGVSRRSCTSRSL